MIFPIARCRAPFSCRRAWLQVSPLALTLSLAAAATLLGAGSRPALACACGCGVFDVGTSAMFPSDSGGTAFLEYDYMDQDHNWSGTSGAPSSNNDDKKIRTSFVTAGLQYMFNRSWGMEAEIPYWQREFKTTEDDGAIDDFNHGALGDIRLRGVYTGFSPDMSTGLTFGLRLPTGDWTYPNFDRDTEIGTGSTDVLLGAFHRDNLTQDGVWTWFVQGSLDQPVLIQGGYRPGSEVDAAAGIYYEGWSLGSIARIAPLVQLIDGYRVRDRGPAADPVNTGYERLYMSPGVEIDLNDVRLYGDIELPVYTQVNGNQLVAPVLFKMIVSYSF